MANAAKTKGAKAKPKAKDEATKSSSSVLTYLFYFVAFLVVVPYCAFVYDPAGFEDLTMKYEVLKPVLQAFHAVDALSPFHQIMHEEFHPKEETTGETQAEKPAKELVLTKEELAAYDGSQDGKGPYLAVLGQVFDVSSKKETYGPNGGYGFFSGKDGSRAFVTGQFDEEGLIDDVTGLTHQDYLGLLEWVQFYHKDYKYVGKVAGRFYRDDGSETEYKKEADGWIGAAQADKEEKNKESQMFPGCNSEWGKKKGHRVWCTNKSGGVTRAWVGRPRKLFLPGRKERCACVKDVGPPSTDPSAKSNVGDLESPHLKEYEGCDPKASSCQISPPEPEEEDDGGEGKK